MSDLDEVRSYLIRTGRSDVVMTVDEIRGLTDLLSFELPTADSTRHLGPSAPLVPRGGVESVELKGPIRAASVQEFIESR